ncbi:hypothetical protein QM240_06695 [Acinetobacter baumannii]|uniref:hypothetical protein n=1 Tax=Acinetobacter baumannii TaxID=470 RepID=UPI000DE727AE|nr:hypothetical protein [Acinetobacter baumannii]MDI9656002.1 hypothetical protein [Acinetobacter baumannii]MDI9667627.1 hypothetical protein [Acinetobacter baumannii]MDI9808448.1 hypothetical protein [Acinetobacter baumannii]MDI9814171.1 hypothetical protein [Acinetobacter baumannii]SSU02622.1 Uncharacterised protein [Acinetobacter baumannii]
MKRVEHLNPIISAILKTNIIFKGRACGRTTLNFFGLCSARLPMLQWDYSKDFCFNPKKIKKISDRKMRKACYQSFALYKKTFKPRSIKKLKIFKDEWPLLDGWQTTMTKMAKTGNKQFSDMADAISYAFFSLNNFRAKYLCTWDLAE